MKVGKAIKKCIGLIYAFIFSFALCGTIVNFKSKVIETRASFTGTFTVNDNTQELEYSPADSYIVTKISMSNLIDNGSGNFDLDVAILGMEPTGGDATERESGTLFFTDATWREEQGTGDYGEYLGILTGKCSELNGGEEVSFRTYTAPNYDTQEDGGWDYDQVNNELSYWSEEYNVDHCTQTAIIYDEYHDYTLTYEIYGNSFEAAGDVRLMDTKEVHLRDASYSPADDGVTEYVGMISGSCDEVEEPSWLSIKALVEPEYVPLNNYQNGFNYVEDEHKLVYFNAEEPRVTYELAWVHFTQYNCQAVINYVGVVGGASDPQAAQIWDAVYDPSTKIITGDLAVLDTTSWDYVSTNTYVELHFGQQSVEENYIDGWNYSQSYGTFIYYYTDATSGEASELRASFDNETLFHYSEVDTSDQYADVTASVQVPGNNEATQETFRIYEASYTEISDGYRIVGKFDSEYDSKTYTIPVDFVVSDLETERMKYNEYVYSSSDHILTYWWDDFTPCLTEITKVVFNNYNDPDDQSAIQYNTVYITYKTTVEETSQVLSNADQICVHNARVIESNGYYVSGELNSGESVTLALPFITYTNEIVDGFNHIRELDEEELIYFDETNRVPYEVAITSIVHNVNAKKVTVYSNRIDLETHEATENEPLELDFKEIVQEQTSVQNGIVKAFFKGNEITLTTPALSRINDGPSGWQYNNGELLWYDKEYDDVLAPTFNYAALNEDTNVMTIQYTLPYENFTGNASDNQDIAIKVSLTTAIEKDEMQDVQAYIITGTCSEVVSGTTITLTIPEYSNEHTGWSYTSDGLWWYDAVYRSEVETTCKSVDYNAFISYSTIVYSLNYADVPDSTTPNREETIHLKNSKVNSANFGDNQVEYTVEGDCIELDQYVVLTIYEPPGVNIDETTGWRYDVNTGLTWNDASFGTIGWESTYAVFNEDQKEAKISFNLLYSTSTVGEIDDQSCDQLVLTNASYEKRISEDRTTYRITGTSSTLDGEISLDVSYLEVMRTGWNYYNSDNMYVELYWTQMDGEYVDSSIYSQLTAATYKEETKTVEFTYGIFEENRTGTGDPDSEKPTLIEEKLIHMQNVTVSTVTNEQNPEFEETYYFFSGTCIECPDANVLSVRESLLTIVKAPEEYDPTAGTITDDQQDEIKDLLPEETIVDEQRMEESIVAISSETAHEIITVINDAHEQNEAALAAGEITQEQYTEKKEIIQTVTEVAVVVGAGATTATDEGKAVDNALPEDHDLGFTMDETLNEFYQTQMEYLLGKKKAPDKEGDSRIKLRANDSNQTTYDITNVSKADYAKMIDFVDTAVSNMKDAALHIRKCSSAKMKVVVKDYIQVVKISSFREFDETRAEEEFVDAIYEAIMLNMQQQVIDSLERSHKPTNNPEKELLYQQQLEVCKNYDTFEQLVLEVLRQKYNSISNAPEISAEDFEGTYRAIFRSWALNKPEENPSTINLEQLTTATIETTKANANRFEFNTAIAGKESTVFIIFGAVAVLGIASAIVVPVLVSKSKQKRA